MSAYVDTPVSGNQSAVQGGCLLSPAGGSLVCLRYTAIAGTGGDFVTPITTVYITAG